MRFLRILSLLLLCTLAATPDAWAHARLVRSLPKTETEYATAPKRVELWFNELLEEGFNTVQVFPISDLVLDKKRNFAQKKPRVDSADRTHLVVDLVPLPPGEYIIEWRVLSRDGHSAPGRATFRVRTP